MSDERVITNVAEVRRGHSPQHECDRLRDDANGERIFRYGRYWSLVHELANGDYYHIPISRCLYCAIRLPPRAPYKQLKNRAQRLLEQEGAP